MDNLEPIRLINDSIRLTKEGSQARAILEEMLVSMWAYCSKPYIPRRILLNTKNESVEGE